jgi:hypothetical protein
MTLAAARSRSGNERTAQGAPEVDFEEQLAPCCVVRDQEGVVRDKKMSRACQARLRSFESPMAGVSQKSVKIRSRHK